MRQSESTSATGEFEGARIDPVVDQAILYVAQYMGSHDDWVDIKIEIMNSVRPELRRLFSRRDQATREQVPSEFDRAVMRRYAEVAGVDPVVRTIRERREMRSGGHDE